MRQLIVNADDFGFTQDVNAGIIAAHTRGILTATTLMATGAAFDDAVRLARAHPTLDIGCHLVLVGSPGYPPTVMKLLEACARGRLNPYNELRKQIVKILDSGIRPTHLDTHKHTHLFPPVLEAVARLAGEFGIQWVRRPFDLPLASKRVPVTKRLVSRAFVGIRSHFHRVLARHGCHTTDHFAGFQITGRYQANDVVNLIAALPEGTTEFMVHPGLCTAELKAATTRLKESREAELKALTSPEVRQALSANHVRLVRYSELA